MLVPNLFLLYVENPESSAVFYEKLFGVAPKAAFPTYVAFEFDNGLTFSLWSTRARDFVSGGSGHRSEIAFMVQNDQMVRDLHERWSKADVMIEQPLREAVFGLTFVAVDPDGHRIRVCTPDR
jgi:predicted enzyme related to lactoylglutathione lyase